MRRLLALFVVVATALIFCGVASAAPRRVPFGFFGVVVDPQLTVDSTPAVLDSQMALMAQSGVESVRTNFFWEGIEPAPGLYDWTQTDAVVEAAAEHHLQLLPILEFTPQWASSHPSSAWPYYAPSNPATFAAFVTALVDRYGSNGTFWSANPTVPRDPIKYWQIWNEPEGTQYDWRSAPWPSTYTTLLKAAYGAIHRADHAARVVSGALVALNGTNLTQWAEARALYRAGFGRYFDVLAVNAFTNAPSVTASVDRSVKIVTLVRQVMRQHNAGGKPIWITELTWTAALGQIPRSEYAGFETTPAGQAERMSAYYRLVASTRPDGIARAFWYTWWSPYVATPLFGNSPTFQYTGLVKWQPGQPFQTKPLLSTYARVAAQFEGCRKSTDAARCR
jgi:Beta-galactosidase